MLLAKPRLYQLSTGIIVCVLLWSCYSYIFSQPAIDGFEALGFPNFFRWQLLGLKLFAVIALVVPFVPIHIKEWAYAGVGLFFLTALVAHVVVGDAPYTWLLNVFFIVLLGVSNATLDSANSAV